MEEEEMPRDSLMQKSVEKESGRTKQKWLSAIIVDERSLGIIKWWKGF